MPTRRELFEILSEKRGESRSIQSGHLIHRVITIFGIEDDEHLTSKLKQHVRQLCLKFFAKLDACSREIPLFLEKNSTWLDKEENLLPLVPPVSSDSESSPKRPPSPKPGPSTSISPKKRSYEGTSQNNESKTKKLSSYSEDEALSLLIGAHLTKDQYVSIREAVREHGVDLYPSYQKLKQAKMRCYGEDQVTETTAEVSLQSLVDHTTSRILEDEKERLSNLNMQGDLFIIFKWGCGGISEHFRHKQELTEQEEEEDEEEDIFLTSLVPVQVYEKTLSGKNIFWQNSWSFSRRYCRPIRFKVTRKTAEIANEERLYVEKQISSLIPTNYTSKSGKAFHVKHLLEYVLTETSDHDGACKLCGISPEMMNNIDHSLSLDTSENTFEFGLSTSEVWICFLECLLQISYRLNIKKWQLCEGDIIKMKERKKRVQEDFSNKLGLLIDYQKPGETKCLNDAYAARIFFKNYKISSEITGVSRVLIYRFGVILRTISCGEELNTFKFNEYGIATARLFVSEYGWFCMPTAVHYILIHGSVVVSSVVLSNEQLAERVQKFRSKKLRKYPKEYVRRPSKMVIHQDVLKKMLISSDPLINSLRRRSSKRPTRKTFEEVWQLLANPLEGSEGSDDSSGDDDSDTTASITDSDNESE